tara:strand:- start:43 stop:336 length:294 start_codon:yes stop_codon:yes gene_type:complete
MYTAKFKCNDTGKPVRSPSFIGASREEVISVIGTYCIDENVTAIGDLLLVNDDFNFNPVNIDMDLVTDDLEKDLIEGLEAMAMDRMINEAANDFDFK